MESFYGIRILDWNLLSRYRVLLHMLLRKLFHIQNRCHYRSDRNYYRNDCSYCPNGCSHYHNGCNYCIPSSSCYYNSHYCHSRKESVKSKYNSFEKTFPRFIFTVFYAPNGLLVSKCCDVFCFCFIFLSRFCFQHYYTSWRYLHQSFLFY